MSNHDPLRPSRRYRSGSLGMTAGLAPSPEWSLQLSRRARLPAFARPD